MQTPPRTPSTALYPRGFCENRWSYLISPSRITNGRLSAQLTTDMHPLLMAQNLLRLTA